MSKNFTDYVTLDGLKSSVENVNIKRFNLLIKQGCFIDDEKKRIYFFSDVEETHLLELLHTYKWPLHPKKYTLCVTPTLEKGILSNIKALFKPPPTVSHPQSIWWNNFTMSFVPNIDLEKCNRCGLREFMEVKWREDGTWYQECTLTHSTVYHANNTLTDNKKEEYEKYISQKYGNGTLESRRSIEVIKEEYQKEEESQRMRDLYLSSNILPPCIKSKVEIQVEKFVPPQEYQRNNAAYSHEEEMCRRVEEMRKGLYELDEKLKDTKRGFFIN